MLRNYFKIGWRNILKYKTFSGINILGLTLSLTTAFLILQYVGFERSYDSFYEKTDQIYRVPINFYEYGEVNPDAMNHSQTGPMMKKDFPEVIDFLRITPNYSQVTLSLDDNHFEEKNVYFADSSYFQFFDGRLVFGDEKNILKEKNTIVLSETVAEKYFGPRSSWNNNIIGKIVKINDRRELIVQGIMKDAPANTHFKANVIISFATFQPNIDRIREESPEVLWSWNDFYTYIMLTPGSDALALEAKFPEFIKKYSKGNTADEYEEFVLQAVSDIHLDSKMSFEVEANGDRSTVTLVFYIALAILIIAWLNYINLSTVNAEYRAKEVGVRKVIGATSKTIGLQFLTEAFIVNALAMGMALALVQVLQPVFASLVGMEVADIRAQLYWVWIVAPILFLFGLLVSAVYPTLVISAYRPADVIKSGLRKFGANLFLRKTLVVFQYTASTCILAGTFVVFQQLMFMQNSKLGFDLDNTLIINAPASPSADSLFVTKYKTLKNEVLKLPEVNLMTSSSAVPGKNYLDLSSHSGIYLEGANEENARSYSVYDAGNDYVETYELELLAGKSFSEELASDDNGALINEEAMKALGLESPESSIGKVIDYWGEKVPIIGVVNNYHHKSLKHKIEPTIIRNDDEDPQYFSLKLQGNESTNLKALIAKVETQWEQIFPNKPFNYFFLDDHFNDQYIADQKLGRLVSAFALLAIFIACIGLFGLVSETCRRRTKEIGIRKVLGASVGSLASLLSLSFLKLVAVALLIAIPMSWYFFSFWLENFAFHIDLNLLVFVLTAAILLFATLLTVGFKTFQTSSTNPIESLKVE